MAVRGGSGTLGHLDDLRIGSKNSGAYLQTFRLNSVSSPTHYVPERGFAWIKNVNYLSGHLLIPVPYRKHGLVSLRPKLIFAVRDLQYLTHKFSIGKVERLDRKTVKKLECFIPKERKRRRLLVTIPSFVCYAFLERYFVTNPLPRSMSSGLRSSRAWLDR